MRMRTDRPLLLGHRGVPSREAENTLASFRAALESGLDGIEIDVHRTRDGVLAVHHDPVTPDGTDLAGVDWKELRGSQPHVPRLEEVFELLEGYEDGFLNVELKTRDGASDGRVRNLADALAAWRHPAADRTWVSCFDPLTLVELARAGARVPLALLAWRDEDLDASERIPELDVAGLHVEQRLATRDLIDRWHGAGRFVFAWTVNSADAARTLSAHGIDGLIGDHPDRLKAATS